MFESTPAMVLAPRLTGGDLDVLYREVKRRIEDHLRGRFSQPLVLLDGQLARERLAEFEARLQVSGVLDGVDVVLATSGSRSVRPHLVGLSWEAILASANATRDFLGRDGTWWLALPMHHIAGFQVVVRSALMGTMPELSPASMRGHSGPRYGALVPTQLTRIPPSDLERFTTLLIGGARLDPTIRQVHEGLPLVTTYGMTETCGGCVYNGIPLPGTRLQIEGERVLLGGSTLMTRYVDEASPLVSIDNQDWLLTGDTGTFVGGKLSITGRVDDIIVSGGENVSAFAVSDAIAAAFPEFRAVEILGVPDHEWGELVVAAIVTDTAIPAGQLGPRVRAAVTAELGPRHAPRLVVTLSQIPLLPTGKLDQRELLRQVLARVGTDTAWQR